jgi:hypothetical protein
MGAKDKKYVTRDNNFRIKLECRCRRTENRLGRMSEKTEELIQWLKAQIL